MLVEHERYYSLGMVALFIVCSVIVCFGTRTLLWFGHGCAIVCSRNTNVYGVHGHGCTCSRMLSEHERDYGLGMDALAFASALP